MTKRDNEPLADIDPNRIKQWEEVGVDAVEADLKTNNGLTYVGADHAIPGAWRWVRYKRKQEQASEREVLTVKPGAYGVSVDLKALGKGVIRYLRKKKPSPEGKE
jgi:hypothetical protein